MVTIITLLALYILCTFGIVQIITNLLTMADSLANIAAILLALAWFAISTKTKAFLDIPKITKSLISKFKNNEK